MTELYFAHSKGKNVMGVLRDGIYHLREIHKHIKSMDEILNILKQSGRQYKVIISEENPPIFKNNIRISND